MLLEDKVAIITGGAVGMGRGMSVRFAQEGCKVIIADINLEAAEATVIESREKGGQALALQCDVTDIRQVEATVGKVLSQFGRVDILINNAGGMGTGGAIEDITEEQWDKTFQLNLKSDYFFCKYVVPHMKERRYGKIINLSSIGAIQPPHHVSHYNSAKSAVIGFTLDLASALAPMNINVNTILPGPIRTEFYSTRTNTMNAKERDDFFAYLGRKTPMQRVGTPEDIAGAALFLSSEMSAYITGQILYVAGGLPLIPTP